MGQRQKGTGCRTQEYREKRGTQGSGEKKQKERDSEQDKGMERKREGWRAGQKAGKKRYCRGAQQKDRAQKRRMKSRTVGCRN